MIHVLALYGKVQSWSELGVTLTFIQDAGGRNLTKLNIYQEDKYR